MVEGGGTLNYSLIRAGLVDRVDMFIAPKIFGGLDARTPVEGTGIAGVDEAVGYVLKELSRHGEDIRLSYVKRSI